jgi:hypothetical protein
MVGCDATAVEASLSLTRLYFDPPVMHAEIGLKSWALLALRIAPPRPRRLARGLAALLGRHALPPELAALATPGAKDFERSLKPHLRA